MSLTGIQWSNITGRRPFVTSVSGVSLTVLNMMRDLGEQAVRSVDPDVEVVAVPAADEFADAMADGLSGEVLLASWLGHPIFEHLDELGVEWMHVPATGVDAWPRELLAGRTVTCARGASAIPIAEFVMGEILAFEKQFPDVWLSAPPERWNAANLGELSGKTLGLIGLGGIGTAVARRALGFDMRVRALRRRPAREALAGVELARDLPDVLASADHLVVAAPATPATNGLLDARAFDLVKPGVHIVNIARGALIDQDALRVALDDGRVAMASLDTVDPEPLPEGHWMYEHPKVRLSAHVSWSTPRGFERMIALFTENLERYLAGQPLHDIVDADEGY
jgi:phosphoglycerate dehydrogenase-like enzyme